MTGDSSHDVTDDARARLLREVGAVLRAAIVSDPAASRLLADQIADTLATRIDALAGKIDAVPASVIARAPTLVLASPTPLASAPELAPAPAVDETLALQHAASAYSLFPLPPPAAPPDPDPSQPGPIDAGRPTTTDTQRPLTNQIGALRLSRRQQGMIVGFLIGAVIATLTFLMFREALAPPLATALEPASETAQTVGRAPDDIVETSWRRVVSGMIDNDPGSFFGTNRDLICGKGRMTLDCQSFAEARDGWVGLTAQQRATLDTLRATIEQRLRCVPPAAPLTAPGGTQVADAIEDCLRAGR